MKSLGFENQVLLRQRCEIELFISGQLLISSTALENLWNRRSGRIFGVIEGNEGFRVWGCLERIGGKGGLSAFFGLMCGKGRFGEDRSLGGISRCYGKCLDKKKIRLVLG